jgi:hypothetical protein
MYKIMGLFTPAWKSKNHKRALDAVEKMTDQKTLAKVAKKARIGVAREAAAAKLTNQRMLADVAINAGDSGARKAAVANLTDQNALSYIAVIDRNEDVRREAIVNLTDQSVLICIAKNRGFDSVREAAIAKLTDQHVLADIAKNDNNWEVCRAAVERLTDPEALRSVTKKYLSDIYAITGECGDYDWQSVKILILIAKKAPQLLKESWQQINSKLKTLHEDTKHFDSSKDSVRNQNGHADTKAVNEG